MPGMNMMNHPHPDDQEAAMARADLYKMANYSFKLFKMIKDGDQLEGWVQAKITKAADYIASVYHYLEYEMKFSEYGSKIENSDMYTEAVREQYRAKLTEARIKLDKLKKKNKKELEEGWEDMMKANKERAEQETKSKGTGKFDKKEIKPGVTQYTRKASSFDDGGDDKDTKKAKKAGKVKEDMVPLKPGADPKTSSTKFYKRNTNIASPPDGATAPPPKGKDGQYPIVTSGPHKGKRWSSKTPGPTNPAMKESKKGDGNLANNAKPYDKVTRGDVIAGRLGKDEKGGKKVKEDAAAAARAERAKAANAMANSDAPQKSGIPATATTTVPGMRATQQDLKKAGASAALGEGKCNHTPKGKSCPVHGLKECGSMYEGHAKNLKQQAAIAIAKKKAK